MKSLFHLSPLVLLSIMASGVASDVLAQGAGLVPPLPPTLLAPPGGSVAPGNAAAPNCVAPPAGLVAWWRAEGNGDDSIGTNNAEVPSAVTYAAGAVGLGFVFDGGTNRVLVPDAPELNFGPGQDFSIEAWIQPLTNSANNIDYDGELMTIFSKRYSPDVFTALGYEVFLAGGTLSFQMDDSPSTYNNFNAGPDLRDGQFHHIAITVQRNSTTGLLFYVDGQLIGTFDPTVAPGDLSNTEPLRIGSHPTPGINAFYRGIMDEVSLYHRALSADEITAIYAAGSGGKCSGLIPPQIIRQPVSQAAAQGGAVVFGVLPGGTGPFGFQWTFNGRAIAGATNVSLSLTNLHPAQAGNYAVKISSPYGATNSATAVLTVITQNLLVYKYSGAETIVTTGQNLAFPYSGVMFFLPANTNGSYVGWATIRGKKTYWVNPISQSLWITIPGLAGQSYTLFGDAGSGFGDDGQAHFRCNLIKGWNTTLTIGTRKTFVFPNTFAGENTHAWPDAQTGRMKLDLATSTFTYAAADTQTANNAGKTLADLITAQVKLLKSEGYQLQ